MPHPRVDQLRFARAELQRGLEGVPAEDALQRLGPMNSISWMVGHLAWHERLVWAVRGQGLTIERRGTRAGHQYQLLGQGRLAFAFGPKAQAIGQCL